MRTVAVLSFLCIAALPACTDFPEVDRAVIRGETDAPYPTLAPMSELEALAPLSSFDNDPTQSLRSRTANLRRKAQSLSSSVLTPSERRLLQQGIARHSG